MFNQSANVEGILGSQIARMGGIYLATGLVIVLFLLQSRDLCLGQDDTLLIDLVLQSLQAMRKTSYYLSPQ